MNVEGLRKSYDPDSIIASYPENLKINILIGLGKGMGIQRATSLAHAGIDHRKLSRMTPEQVAIIIEQHASAINVGFGSSINSPENQQKAAIWIEAAKKIAEEEDDLFARQALRPESDPSKAIRVIEYHGDGVVEQITLPNAYTQFSPELLKAATTELTATVLRNDMKDINGEHKELPMLQFITHERLLEIADGLAEAGFDLNMISTITIPSEMSRNNYDFAADSESDWGKLHAKLKELLGRNVSAEHLKILIDRARLMVQLMNETPHIGGQTQNETDLDGNVTGKLIAGYRIRTSLNQALASASTAQPSAPAPVVAAPAPTAVTHAAAAVTSSAPRQVAPLSGPAPAAAEGERVEESTQARTAEAAPVTEAQVDAWVVQQKSMLDGVMKRFYTIRDSNKDIVDQVFGIRDELLESDKYIELNDLDLYKVIDVVGNSLKKVSAYEEKHEEIQRQLRLFEEFINELDIRVRQLTSSGGGGSDLTPADAKARMTELTGETKTQVVVDAWHETVMRQINEITVRYSQIEDDCTVNGRDDVYQAYSAKGTELLNQEKYSLLNTADTAFYDKEADGTYPVKKYQQNHQKVNEYVTLSTQFLDELEQYMNQWKADHPADQK